MHLTQEGKIAMMAGAIRNHGEWAAGNRVVSEGCQGIRGAAEREFEERRRKRRMDRWESAIFRRPFAP